MTALPGHSSGKYHISILYLHVVDFDAFAPISPSPWFRTRQPCPARFMSILMNDLKAAILDLQMPCNHTNLKIYQLSLWSSTKLIGYPKSRCKAILNENLGPNGNHPFCIRWVHSSPCFWLWVIYHICHTFITTIDCGVIINNFGLYYQDFQLAIGTFQIYFHTNKWKNKDCVVVILAYKMTVKNKHLKICPLDSLTSKVYT